MKIAGPIISLVALLSLAQAAEARVTQDDVQVAVRALSFLERPPSGDLRLAIVYAADSPQSVKAADDLRRMLGSSQRAGNLVLLPSLVRTDQLAGVRADALFLTEGVGPEAARQVKAAAQGGRIPCLTVDLDQVRNGVCTVGVSSNPRVQVFVNRALAAASGLSFSTMFRIMITEL